MNAVDATLTLVIFLASILASVISGTFGMAGGMVLMGIYSAILPVSDAMVLHGITQFSANGYRWWLLRHHTYWHGIRGYVLGCVCAVAVFSIAGIIPDKAVVYLVLGGIPFLAASLPSQWRLDFSKRRAPVAAGILVSAIQLVAGAAGPALDIFFIDTKLSKNEIVATKALTQTISHAAKILYFTGIVVMVAGSEHSFQIPWWICGMSVAATFVGT